MKSTRIHQFPTRRSFREHASTPVAVGQAGEFTTRPRLHLVEKSHVGSSLDPVPARSVTQRQYAIRRAVALVMVLVALFGLGKVIEQVLNATEVRMERALGGSNAHLNERSEASAQLGSQTWTVRAGDTPESIAAGVAERSRLSPADTRAIVTYLDERRLQVNEVIALPVSSPQ